MFILSISLEPITAIFILFLLGNICLEGYCEFRAAYLRVTDRDASSLKLHYLLDKGKSQAVALGFMRAVRLIEAVEYMLFCFVGNARSLVGDREDYLIFNPIQGDDDPSASRTEFYGVADKI